MTLSHVLTFCREIRGCYILDEDIFQFDMFIFFFSYDLVSILALQLARTCYNFYQMTETKLAGENYFFNPGQVCPSLHCSQD